MPKKPPTNRKLLRFCHTLHEETGGDMRWAIIMAVARRLDLDVRVAILLATECAAADLVWLDVRVRPMRYWQTQPG